MLKWPEFQRSFGRYLTDETHQLGLEVMGALVGSCLDQATGDDGLGHSQGQVCLIQTFEAGAIGGLLGAKASELLNELVLAQNWDLTTDEIGRSVHIHPTLSEAVKEAAHGISGHMINF
ncbi:hypothetical protein AR0_02205 [Corynebacterium glutamicum]|nr:hypothetical protein AR0_02205 [Corynebacterium glutamicum]